MRLRPMLAGLPVYRAGQGPSARTDVRTFKLSSNEAPIPPGEAVLAAVREAPPHLYPDPGSTQLIAALAGYLGVGAEQLCVGCGSVSLCQNAVQISADPGDEVVFAWRSFEAYPIITAISAARAVEVPLTSDARHDVEAMVDAVTARTRVLFLCTPNNPTGPVVSHDEARWVIDSVGEDVLVVIDEAYHEYVRDPSAVRAMDLARSHPNVLVLRTFSKAFGLAGLRVGYGMGSPDVVTAMRKVATPFGVATPAQMAATQSLQPAGLAQMRTVVAETVSQRERMVAGLRALGFDVPDTQANFVWIASAEAAAMAAYLDEAGLTVRPFPEGIRVSIGPAEANDRVLEALAGWNAGTHQGP